MASYYGVLFPEFWTGRTGRAIQRAGGAHGQVLALYLMSTRHANMIGLYRLAVDDIVYETGLKAKAVVAAGAVLEATGFAQFDRTSEFVWVPTMCRFRLGLKAGESLPEKDNRVVGVNKLYHGVDANPFLGDFYVANHQTLRLTQPRDPQGIVAPMWQPSPSQGASKTLVSQLSGSGSDNRDQGSDIRHQEKAGRCTTGFPQGAPKNVDGPNVNVITRLAHDAYANLGDQATIADLADALKFSCAKHGIGITPEAITTALESARHQRTRRRA